jgi:hypothetical protein
MILFQKEMSYLNRIFSQMSILTLVLIFILGVIGFAFEDQPFWILLVVYSFPLIIFACLLFRSSRNAIYWISLIEVNKEDNCHIVIKYKDAIERDIDVLKSELKFELKPYEGRYTYYKLLVYKGSDLIVTQCAVDDWGRYKMQEIVQYFHPEDKMAKKKKL